MSLQVLDLLGNVHADLSPEKEGQSNSYYFLHFSGYEIDQRDVVKLQL